MLKLDKKSYFVFSGGEVHCKFDFLSEPNGSLIVLMKDYTMDGLMALAEYCEIAYRHKCKVHVIYPYFPYARQDRVIAANEPFSLRIFCKFLNSLSLASVTIVDPHSDVCSALIHDVRIIPQWEAASASIPAKFFDDKEVLFVSPDAGAYKKLSKLIGDDKRIIIGTKERDEKGVIIKTNVYSPIDITGKTCIVVDDICDGGRTFVELGKVLKEKGAKELYLYVTHGIFSKGLKELLTYYDEIYTTNSFEQSKHLPQLKVTEIIK